MSRIEVYYECPSCRLESKVSVRERYANESEDCWLDEASAAVDLYHNLLSPVCAWQELHLLVPMLDEVRGPGYSRPLPKLERSRKLVG